MDQEPRLTEQWPLLVTCLGFVLMGVFILTATSDPDLGWVFVVFGAGVIVVTLTKAVVAAVRARRG